MVDKVGIVGLRRHYDLLSRLRVRLSDREATAFMGVGITAAVLFAFSIVQLSGDRVQPGHVYSVMTYLWGFVSSLDEAPLIIDQLSRLRDIGRRIVR